MCHVGVGWDGSCRGGMGHGRVRWDSHGGVGWVMLGWVGHVGVGWVMQG